MLTLFEFQSDAVERVKLFNSSFDLFLSRFLEASLPVSTVGAATWNDLQLSKEPYSELVTNENQNIPNCCLMIPTGGGKTITGLFAAIEILLSSTKVPNFIVWLTPTDAIYKQTLKSFSPGGVYFLSAFERFGKKINLKTNSDTWSDADLLGGEEITILLLGKDSLIRNERSRESLRIYRNPDNVSALSVLHDCDTPSLFELLKVVKPVFVADESHKIYTSLSQEFFKTNPVASFILELTATPKEYDSSHRPNIIFNASGAELISNGLIKKTIKYNSTVGQDTTALLAEVVGLRNKIAEKAQAAGQTLQPKVLLSVEYTSRKKAGERHSVDEIANILNELGVAEEQIVIKSSERDQLGERDLDDPLEPAQFVLTKTALVEGWDCKSVYIIVLLNNIGARLTNAQIVGRGLRQPRQSYFLDDALNTLYLVTNSSRHDEAISTVQSYLYENGLGEITVRTGNTQNKIRISSTLVSDPKINYLKFDKNIYKSLNTKRQVEDYLHQNIKLFSGIFSKQEAEAMQAVINVPTATASALAVRTLPSAKFTRTFGSIGHKKLEKKLYFTARPFFRDSFKCLQTVRRILEENTELNRAPSDEIIVENFKNTLATVQQEFLEKKFLDFLVAHSTPVEGSLSSLFAHSFEISTATNEFVSFDNCVLDRVPTDFLNNQELDFARKLDALDCKWLKTSPEFKIEFPYPMGTFYPDFVLIPLRCGAADFKTYYIETKGEHLLGSDESKLKAQSCRIITNHCKDSIQMIFGSFDECWNNLNSVLKA